MTLLNAVRSVLLVSKLTSPIVSSSHQTMGNVSCGCFRAIRCISSAGLLHKVGLSIPNARPNRQAYHLVSHGQTSILARVFITCSVSTPEAIRLYNISGLATYHQYKKYSIACVIELVY